MLCHICSSLLQVLLLSWCLSVVLFQYPGKIYFNEHKLYCTCSWNRKHWYLVPTPPLFLPHVHMHNQVKQLVSCVCVCTRTGKNGASWQWRMWRTAWLVLRDVRVLRKWGRWRRNGHFSRQPYAFFASLATAPLSCTHESRCRLHGVVAAFWLPVFASIFAPVS